MHRIGEKTRTDEPSSSRAIQKRPAESKVQEVDVKAGRRALNGRALDGWMDGMSCGVIISIVRQRRGRRAGCGGGIRLSLEGPD